MSPRNETAVPLALPLILASASPRRRQLLADAGFTFNAILPDAEAEDDRLPEELPTDYVRRLSVQKGENVARKTVSGIILSCDTIVLCGDAVLEKPADREDARRMLRQLRGEVHSVLSGISLITRQESRTVASQVQTETTKLVMEPISDQQIEMYLETGQWRGKAGGFGYQDGNDWIRILSGSESNVVGLPMELFSQMYRLCCIVNQFP